MKKKIKAIEKEIKISKDHHSYLEKCKFVLDYKIKEIKKETGPLDKTIDELKKHTKGLERVSQFNSAAEQILKRARHNKQQAG